MDALVAIIAASAGLASLGAIAMLTLGLRGRRIDDHPVCRGCSFDLVGVYPGAAVCPECGRALTGRTVRIGQRRARRGLVIAGLAGLAAVVTAAGLVGVQTARGFDWNTVKPASLLAWEVRRGDRGGRAAAELWTRQRMGDLDPGVLGGMVEPILTRQADAARPWDANLAELFVAAWDAGLASDEQALRFVRQGVNVELSARRREEGIAVVAAATRLRGGMTPAFFVRMTPRSVTLGGAAIEPIPGLGLNFALQTGLTNTATAAIAVAEPATDVFEIVWEVRVGGRGQQRRYGPLGTWDMSQTVRVGP